MAEQTQTSAPPKQPALRPQPGRPVAPAQQQQAAKPQPQQTQSAAQQQAQQQQQPKPQQQSAQEQQASAPPFIISSPRRRERWYKELFYGDYGVGKTTLAASAIEVPEMRDVLFIDAEAGDLSLVDYDVDVIRVTNYRQVARVYEFLRLHCRYRDAGDLQRLRALEAQFRQCSPEDIVKPRKYRTVVIDSLSEVHKYCMYQLLGVNVGLQRLDVEPENAEWNEWGKASEMLRLLVRSFRDLPMHVIFVCSEQVKEDERKQMHRSPNLPGKLAGEVMGFVDVVGYLVAGVSEGGEVARRLWLQPGKTFKAKNRFGQSGVAYLDNPSMKDLVALLQTQPAQQKA